MRFRLVQYFTVASLIAFTVVASALILLERQQAVFFRDVQANEAEVFGKAQDDFTKRQDEIARRDLLAVHENGNVNLTRLFANTLWERDFSPFVARAQAIDVDHCRALPAVPDASEAKNPAADARKACFAEVGRRIMAIPGFAELDARVFDAVRKSSVFKIKVFDLRGVTIYSSEHGQVGEDKSMNAGWQSAARDGKAKSELTFRGKFSAFEGVVENRDLISSYLPVLQPGTSDRIVGVFEVYSDVTPFLAQIKATSAALQKTAGENQRRLALEAAANQERVEAASRAQVLVVAGLLLVLFAILFVIVRRAQGLIEEQENEREQARQKLLQADKMASLGQMVAGVTHQLNTPLAFSQNNVALVRDALQTIELPLRAARRMSAIIDQAEGDRVVLDISQARARLRSVPGGDVDIATLRQMLGDVLDGIAAMSELVVNLRNFTRLDRSRTADADLNQALRTVVYIARTTISHDVEIIEEYGQLPAVECNVSQLNQAFLNLLNNAAQAIVGAGSIRVVSKCVGDRVCVSIADSGAGIDATVLPHIFDAQFTTKPAGEGTGLGLGIARDIVREHGGEIRVETQPGVGSCFSVLLPLRPPALLAKAA